MFKSYCILRTVKQAHVICIKWEQKVNMIQFVKKTHLVYVIEAVS